MSLCAEKSAALSNELVPYGKDRKQLEWGFKMQI